MRTHTSAGPDQGPGRVTPLRSQGPACRLADPESPVSRRGGRHVQVATITRAKSGDANPVAGRGSGRRGTPAHGRSPPASRTTHKPGPGAGSCWTRGRKRAQPPRVVVWETVGINPGPLVYSRLLRLRSASQCDPGLLVMPRIRWRPPALAGTCHLGLSSARKVGPKIGTGRLLNPGPGKPREGNRIQNNLVAPTPAISAGGREALWEPHPGP